MALLRTAYSRRRAWSFGKGEKSFDVTTWCMYYGGNEVRVG